MIDFPRCGRTVFGSCLGLVSVRAFCRGGAFCGERVWTAQGEHRGVRCGPGR